MKTKLLCIAIASAALTACGGGGGGGSSSGSGDSGSGPSEPTGPTVLTGSFIDSPVEGLYFETETQSGLTNAAGEFQYLDGEVVTFHVGGTTLGAAVGQEEINPFDLEGISPIEREASILSTLQDSRIQSFDRAINIASFLQALDADNNPDNGIDLGDANNLLAELEINLSEKALSFAQNSILNTAASLAGGSNEITFESVVKHLYSSLDVDIVSSRTSSYSASSDNNALESISYQYNTSGQVTNTSFDKDSDGTIDSTKTFRYNGAGLIESTSDTGSNIEERYSYDDNGNLTSLEIERSGGDTTTQTYAYDSGNRVTRSEVDFTSDGSPDSITSYTYDDDGNVTRVDFDRDGDGTVESNNQYVYVDGRVSVYTSDANNDDVPNIIIVYSYDENGNRTSYNIDVTSDGFPDAIRNFEYDANNNPVRFELDNDLDDIPDYVETYRYNANGQRSYQFRDNDADGDWDHISQYFYDENGNQTQTLEDFDADGIADKVWEGNYVPLVLDNGWDLILAELDS